MIHQVVQRIELSRRIVLAKIRRLSEAVSFNKKLKRWTATMGEQGGHHGGESMAEDGE